jgi:DNA polymerase I
MYLDWEKQAQDYYAVDIETDDLNATKIWVMCWENIRTKEAGTCTSYDEIRSFFERTKGSAYVGHNILKFDAPVLNRIIGLRLGVSRLVDTLVLSTLYSPSLPNGHSLEEWGQRIGFPKGVFNDWSKLSDEMIVYCRQDVKVTAELFRKMVRVLNKVGFSERSCFIQHHITTILHRQQNNGFEFDAERAMLLYQQLRQREEELMGDVRAVFPPERKYVATRNMYKKDGTETKIYQQDKERYIIQVSNEPNIYMAFEDVEFNLGSYTQRTQRLLDLGWVNLPDEVTKGGNPKPFDKGDLVPSLKQFLEDNPMPEVELIVRWMSVNGRANMINNWLENWNEDTGRIHGKLFVADTLRFRHQAPNTANIPAVRVTKQGDVLRGDDGYWTYESRDLWVARPGRVLVGTDAAGLELRMLAHYLNREDFTDGVVNGDPHQSNADLAGVTRPQAKTLIYACLYGAQGPKIAKTLGISVPEGKAIRQQFLDKLGIGDVMQEAMNEQKVGRVWLVDGSGVICPSPHAALNYKLQGGGARVMALGSILLERHIKRCGLDSLKVGDIHDEWQYDVHPRCAAEHGRLAIQSIREAGEELNLNVPLDGTSKEGRTWAQTH